MRSPPTWERLTLRVLASRGGTGLLSRLLSTLAEPPPGPATLAAPAVPLLSALNEQGLPPDLLDDLLADDSDDRALVQTASTLRAQGVQILLRGAPEYPAPLLRARGAKAPPVLFVQGRLDLLSLPAVGFCGSRHATERGLDIAAECSVLLASRGLNIVSGHAAGVDLSVHQAALQRGVTTLVLAEGILGFRPRRPIADLARADNLLVVSEFSPRLPWSAGNAMTRNHTICGLSGALIVIEAGARGGTLAAGHAALAQGLPLFVVDYGEPVPQAAGNPELLAHGGVPLRRRRSGEANLDPVLQAALGSGPPPREPQG